MLSFLVIFPNPFIQAKLVTTKTWLLCYMSVSSFSSIFFVEWGEKKCGEIFAYPLQLPLTPKAQTCPIFTIWFQSSSGVWFIVILFDYLVLLVKHFWSSFDTSRIHCSQVLHHIRNVQQIDSGDTQRVLF